jgi:hypothetical protein
MGRFGKGARRKKQGFAFGSGSLSSGGFGKDPISAGGSTSRFVIPGAHPKPHSLQAAKSKNANPPKRVRY